MSYREINRIVVGCSYTEEQDIGLAEINQRDYELGLKPQDGLFCRWHYVIRRNGVIEKARPEYFYPEGLGRYNSDSLAICLIGGINSDGLVLDNFTESQKDNLADLCLYIREEYPDANLLGYSQLSCADDLSPCFNVPKLIKDKSKSSYV